MRRLIILISYSLFLISASAEVVLQRGNIDVVSTEGGWQVVNRVDGSVLAYGDSPLELDNLAPAFQYMLDLYDQGSEVLTTEGRSKVKRKAFQNVSPLCTSHWAQGSPYYNKCPMYGGSRCVTGCVATAMAQVLYFHKLPKTMHGFKTYGYQNQGNQRVNLSFDYGATTFDWANMKDSYGMTSSSAAKEAVATLMYACGVGASMRYTTSESGTNTWVGADAINCFMDGIRAEHSAFSTDVVNAELQAGRPVIYAGASQNGGAHCFVIDGSNTNGYFHCNLGWGGGNDGYYLPTDMCGYGASNQELVRVYPSDEVPTFTPMAELQGKYVKAIRTPAATIEPNRWYVLWNAGRAGSPVSNGVGKEVTNTSSLPAGESTIYCAPQLVRFVPNSAGTAYYIQTGLGDYWSTFTAWGGSGKTTSNRSATFTKGTIRDDYFWLKSSTGAYLDTNGPGSTVVGWNTQVPTDTVSNSSWRVFPLTISDEEFSGLPNFDAEATYTLRNTGYSQGYLVAISADDPHPTLRGVTQDHSAGLYEGARYHEAADMKSDGTYWRITREGDNFYLKNELTQKYLTNQGDKTTYVFIDTKAALHIAKRDDGTCTINAGTQAESYLCAATQLENPAAFWTADDAGSIWLVEEVEWQDPTVGINCSPTAISQGAEANAPIVDLQGKRIAADCRTKGVYIQNRKKIIK